MNVFLPTPYPDELYMSTVQRYLVHTRSHSLAEVLKHIFGRNIRQSITLPFSLGVAAARSCLAWNMTGEEIAFEMTLFPYYSRYLPFAMTQKYLEETLSPKRSWLRTVITRTRHRIIMNKYLMFCKACRRHDMSEYGETYWRRSLQLPGVLVCPDHSELLVPSKALAKPFEATEYMDATEATEEQMTPEIELGSEEIKKALMIAGRCREILKRPMPQWSSDNVSMLYRESARKKGLIGRTLRFSLAEFETALVEFYSKTLLVKLGCDFQSRDEKSWVRRILRHNYVALPLHHALVQLFLENVSRDLSSKAPFGLGPWRCPNPYGEHEDEFPIKNPTFHFINGELFARATCQCGYRFTFKRTTKRDPQMPVPIVIMEFGPAWNAELRRLRRCGLSEKDLEGILHISRSTIGKILKGWKWSPPVPVAQSEILRLRKEWLRLLQKVPGNSRVIAKQVNPKLTYMLNTYDHDWFLVGSSRRVKVGTGHSSINWEKRDQEWALLIKKAAKKIRMNVPLQRVSRPRIFREAFISNYSRKKNLILCEKALDMYTESEKQFQDRKERFLLRSQSAVKK